MVQKFKNKFDKLEVRVCLQHTELNMNSGLFLLSPHIRCMRLNKLTVNACLLLIYRFDLFFFFCRFLVGNKAHASITTATDLLLLIMIFTFSSSECRIALSDAEKENHMMVFFLAIDDDDDDSWKCPNEFLIKANMVRNGQQKPKSRCLMLLALIHNHAFLFHSLSCNFTI